MAMTSRLARLDNLPTLQLLVDAAIDVLQKGFLGEGQIAASRAIMGIDRQLIEDGTYFVVEIDGEVAGCGGWSRRATKYGGDHSAGRDSHLLRPATDPAQVRAMYSHPAFVLRGVGREPDSRALPLFRCGCAANPSPCAAARTSATRPT